MSTDHSTARRRDLGRRVALIRQRAGFNAMALARKMGVHVPTLCRFENGQRGLSDVKFIQYLTLCGLKPNEIEPLLAMHHTPENGFHHADFA
ncbi:MAG TPA: helix-turn-helix transcriptional regulator, partial [Pseudonocardiaceae bacterium]|nr:helix-turn-helix transcriptional regulator [Pseudonocardiaceae bacterium]